MKYSNERRQAVLAKLCPPHNRSIREVAAEEGISEATLYNWRKQARARGELYSEDGSDAEGWTERVNLFPTLRRFFLCNNLGKLRADRGWRYFERICFV